MANSKATILEKLITFILPQSEEGIFLFDGLSWNWKSLQHSLDTDKDFPSKSFDGTMPTLR